MRGFLGWFKSVTKMKRWLFIILIGVSLICYGFAKFIALEEISISETWKIAIIFVIGFISVIVGFVFAQKRTMELIVEGSIKKEENKNDIGVKSLIFNKKIFDKGPNVVLIGEGAGLNNILRGLREYTSNITSVIPVHISDDVKEPIQALSKAESEMKKLLNHQFRHEALKDMNFGDIYLTAMTEIYGGFAQGIKRTNEVLSVRGSVMPVTLDDMTISAELEDGTNVSGKDNIYKVLSEKITRIKRVFIKPSNVRPNPDILEAIRIADAIVIGPGSLYTSVIPNLLIGDIAQRIKQSPAMKIYVCNIMTKPGETDDYTAYDHIKAIHDHVGKGVIDFCICNTGEIVPEFVKKYNREGAEPVSIDKTKVRSEGVVLVSKELANISGEYIRHNSKELASTIFDIVCDEYKYKNMEDSMEYLSVKHKLKQEKEKKKEATKREKKNNKIVKPNKGLVPKETRMRKPSKFYEKYQDRIEEIKESTKDK